MSPRVYGKFRLLELLPKGGMGTVYLAENRTTGQHVALKLIELGSDEDRMEILAAERRGARLQEQLCRRDPRIVCIRSWGEFDGYFFIEMDFVEGYDLSQVLRERTIGIPFATRIAIDLCEALHHAHTAHLEIDGQQYRGVVHGDIKPRNIRITKHGEVRILDFGIAKALSMTRSVTRIQFGSVQYSSPERLRSGDLDIASDLWAVAAVLFESAAGRPYMDEESPQRIDAVLRSYRLVKPIPERVPPPLAAILRKALAPDPAARYSSAQALAGDLRAFREKRPTLAEAEGDLWAEATRRTTAAGGSHAAGADSEKTRRTVSVSEDNEATRRTGPPPPVAPPPAAAPNYTRVPRERSGFSRRIRQAAAAAALLFILISAVMTWREYRIWSEASQLSHDLESEKTKDLNAAWETYTSLRERSFLPILLWGAKDSILDRLTAAADRTILEYRDSESPTVSENDWLRARNALARALELDPGDKQIRGKLYLAEGHINRIRGTSRVSGKMLNEARSKFDQARELMSKSPDPWLGLARLYVYSLRDVEKAEDALRQAAKRGHPIGRREKAQLADGYRERAERLLQEADAATGQPEERDYLERARADLNRAQDFYREIIPFGRAAASLRQALEYSDNIDIRLRAIREGA